MNVHIDIPLFEKAGRGVPVRYVLSYDSSIWSPVTSGSVTTWSPTTNYGWRTWSEIQTGMFLGKSSSVRCPGTPISAGLFKFTITFKYRDSGGTVHALTGSYVDNTDCGGSITPADGMATDGSGLRYHVDETQSYVLAPGGTKIDVTARVIQDSNGNKVSTTGSDSTGYTLTDTTGFTAMTVSGSSANPVAITYTNPAGGSSQVQIQYSSFTVKTNFTCSATNSGPTTVSLPDRITFPDGSYYAITYEETPGVAGAVTGRVASLRLPTGATITYNYSGANNGIVCTDGSAPALSRTTPDGTWTYSRDYSDPANSKTTITDPSGNETAINFVPNGGNFYETSRQDKQGTTTVLRTVQTCYNGAAFPCDGAPITMPISRTTVTTQLAGMGSSSKVDTQFNSYGLTTQRDEYKFGATTPARKTVVSYATLGNNIVGRPSSVVVKDGSDVVKAQTNYSYDEYAVVATSGTPQLAAVSGSRGNLTTVSRLVQGTTFLSQNFYYYDTGNVQKVVDAKGNQTTLAYAQCGNSFLTSVSRPLSLSASANWDCAGGVQTSVTDENSRTTTYGYADPNLWRVTSVSYPDGSQQSFTYSTGATTPWSTGSSTKLNATQNLTTTTILDTLGRATQQQLTSDPDGTAKTDSSISFGDTGLLILATNPYRNTSEPTYGTSTTEYDAIGRAIELTRQDGNVATNSYSGNCITSTDEAGKQKKQCFNGFGLIIQVYEPDSTGALNWLTEYEYDTLNNLTNVTQKGGSTDSAQWRTRTFSYDGLSRLTQETTPEAGTVNYYYTTSAGVLCSGSPSDVCRRTDARSKTTTYAYDALGRLTGKAYSDSTPAVNYYYDQTSYNGLTISNGKGRRTGMSDGSGSTAWSFDVMGRVLTRRQTISGVTKSTSFTYNLAGAVTSITYPSGRVVNYAYNNAGQAVSAIDAATSKKYVSNAHYNAAGILTGMYNGETTGWISVSRTTVLTIGCK